MTTPTDVAAVEISTSTLATDRSRESWSTRIGRNGCIIAAAVVTSGAAAPRRGQTRVQVFVCAGAPSLDNIKYALASDYVYDNYVPAGWGCEPVKADDYLLVQTRNSVASHVLRVKLVLRDYDGEPTSWVTTLDTRTDGVIRTVTGTDPAAGVEASDAVPTGALWDLIVWSVVLVTAVAVANRTVNIVIDDGTTANRRGIWNTLATQAASLTRTWIHERGSDLIGAGGQTVVDTATCIVNGELPVDMGRLSPAYRIRSLTLNLQAADDLAAPIFQVEENLVP